MLITLRDDFDRLIEHMQTPMHNAAGGTLFAAGGAELGTAAAARARKVAKTTKGTAHTIAMRITPSCGNVFLDLGF